MTSFSAASVAHAESSSAVADHFTPCTPLPMKLCVLCASPPHTFDAVGDACWCLTKELARQGNVSLIVSGTSGTGSSNGDAVTLVPVSPGWGLRTVRDVMRCVARLQPDVVLVHFVPQLYGWNGAKPGLALLLHMLKRRRHRIVTIAHEFTAPFGPSPKLMAWSMIHRILLRVIVRASRQIVLTTALRCEILRRRFTARRQDCLHIPLGCTIPVAPVDRLHERSVLNEQYDIDSEEMLVATFGSRFEAMPSNYKLLFQRMIAAGIRFRVLLIGKMRQPFQRSFAQDPAMSDKLRWTGPVPDSTVSRLLSLSDLFVAFYPDGASTHRTSLLAGLAHGVPTISNRGVSTEPSLASSGAVVFTDHAASEEEFAVIRDLCRNADRRSDLSRRGREFHEKHHSWSRIGRAYLNLINDAHESS